MLAALWSLVASSLLPGARPAVGPQEPAAAAPLAPESDPAAQTGTARIAIDVVGPAAVDRASLVLVSLPFARGELAPPSVADQVLALGIAAADGSVLDADAVGVPLLRWPDESVALLQVALRVRVPGRGRVRVFAVPRRRADGAPDWRAAAPHRPLLAAPLPLWTEVLDPWGRVYRADLEPDPTAGPDGVLVDAGRFCVRRFRCAHRGRDAAVHGRPFVDLRAYLLTFAGERRGELTLVLDDQEPSTGPLGPVRLGGFRMVTSDPRLCFVPAFVGENDLPLPQPRTGGGHVQWLLAPGADVYLGDGTAKAFRVHLWQDGDDVADEERAAARWGPLRTQAFADVDAVRRTRAFAASGGPAPQLAADPGDAGAQFLGWYHGARGGPFSGFGDPENGALGGAPRLGDSLLHNVLRWRSAELLQVAEGMVLQHGLRPTGGRAPRLPDDMAAYRAGMPPLAIAAPHGFLPIDYEHCSVHLLFDYYWLTGDAWARDELARVGASLRAMLLAVPFRTARGEGNCLLAGALCGRATGDRALLAWLADHVQERVLPALAAEPSAAVLPQPPHEQILGGDVAFDAPMQMAQLVRGLAALYAATDDQRLLPMVARTARAMAGSAWAEGEGPKTFVSADDPGRYTMAASPEDRSGADRMVIGALVLAAELAGEPATAARLSGCAEFLLGRELPADAGLPARLAAAANPWLQIALDRRRSP